MSFSKKVLTVLFFPISTALSEDLSISYVNFLCNFPETLILLNYQFSISNIQYKVVHTLNIFDEITQRDLPSFISNFY